VPINVSPGACPDEADRDRSPPLDGAAHSLTAGERAKLRTGGPRVTAVAWASGDTVGLAAGNSVIARSPRNGAVGASARERHFVGFDACRHALIEPSHDCRIPPMSPTSHVQFERPRVERPQRNHCSPAAGRRHTRRGAGTQAGAVHGSGQPRGQGRAAGRLARCSLGGHHQGHRARTRRSVRRGWVRDAHRDGDWPGKRERQASVGQRRCARDARQPPVALNSRRRRLERAEPPPRRTDASQGVPRCVVHARFMGEGVGGPEGLCQPRPEDRQADASCDLSGKWK
jgi:hypothetical protein